MKWIIIVLIIIIVFPSCNNKKTQNKYEPIKKINVEENNKYNNKDLNDKYLDNKNAKQIASNILKSTYADGVIIVLNKNKALVGLNIENKDQINYKKIVIEEIKKVDSNILDIMITTDKSMYKRIKKLNDDIESERPLSGIMHNFMDIFKTQ